MAEFERGGPGDELLGMAKPHMENADRHAGRRPAHERLKKHHHTVLAHWLLLLRAITQKA